MKLTLKEKVGYGLGDTASNFVWALMMNFILFYYTDIFGIGPAAAGTMLMFARSTDGIADFLIGAMADRTKTRWGRFRPYLVWMCFPLAIAFVLTFTTPDFEMRGKLVYAWITYNVLMLCYSAINIPYGALSGVMTDDPEDRNSLNAYRMGFAQVGGLIANTSFLGLVTWFGGSDKSAGAQSTVIFFSAIALVLFLLTFFATTERIHPPPGQKTRLMEDVKTLGANRHWMVVVAAGITAMAFMALRGSDMVFYLEKYLKWEGNLVRGFWFFTGVFTILGAVLTKPAIRAAGTKKNAYIISMALMGVTAVPFYWISPEHTVTLFFWMLAGSIVGGINSTLFWSLVADTADFSEWKFKVRTTGIIFSAITCAQKIGMGLGAAATGYALAFFNYQLESKAQSPEALHGILLLVSLIPAAGYFAVALIFTRYGLTETVCHEIRTELADRRAKIAG